MATFMRMLHTRVLSKRKTRKTQEKQEQQPMPKDSKTLQRDEQEKLNNGAGMVQESVMNSTYF